MKKGFALIYVLTFVVLLLIAVSAIWFTGMADLRLSRRSTYSVQAYQLAQSAVEDGWVAYKTAIGTTDVLNQNLPSTAACTLDPTNGYAVHRVTIASDGSLSPSDAFTKTSVNLAPYGVYDYRVCGQVIEGTGYYKGNKITLKADVSHPANECTTITNPDNTTTTTCGHSGDFFIIYQVGPQQ